MTRLRAFLLMSLVFVGLACLAWGDDNVYIRNRPFHGGLIGTGRDPSGLRVELESVVRSLGLRLTESGGNWIVSRTPGSAILPSGTTGTGKLVVLGKELAFSLEGHQKYVNLGDLGRLVGARFIYNEDSGTLDMDFSTNPSASDGGMGWGASSSAKYRLVYFGNDQVAPASRHFRPVLQQIEKDTKVPVVWIDTEKTSSDLYRAFIRFFDGGMIPHTVLVDSKERVLKRWTGSIPYNQFVSQLRQITQ